MLTIAYSAIYQRVFALKQELSGHSLPVIVVLQCQLILKEVHICSLIYSLSEKETPFIMTDLFGGILPLLQLFRLLVIDMMQLVLVRTEKIC